MRIAILHNRYRQAGGEDNVVEQEIALLRDHGHEVVSFIRDNNSIAGGGSIRLAVDAIWSRSSATELEEFLCVERPDIVHAHNTFPLLSPAVYHVASQFGCPTVLTLHNFRLLCPSATFYRHGGPCIDCLGRTLSWPGIVHGCYRGSRSATAAVASMNAIHRLLGTWTTKVCAFVALTEFARELYIRGGIPADRTHVRPNYVVDPGPPMARVDEQQVSAIYAGRISEEKGLSELVEAWRSVKIPLKIFGEGPLLESLRSSAPSNIEFHGRVSRDQLLQAMRSASFMVVPSTWFEGFPLVVVEAMSVGLPVIASGLGSLAEVVEHEQTGLHFEAGQIDSLASAALRLAGDSALRVRLGSGARNGYLKRYTPETTYEKLMAVYAAAATVIG